MPSAFQTTSARRRFYRRCFGTLLLGAFVVTAAGIPLPAGTKELASNKSNDLFMCATSRCGCRTAEQCWRSCCCHSLAERIAWARQYGVTPPAFALAQARAAGIDIGCCAMTNAKRNHSCCETRLAAAPTKPSRSCCSKHAHVAAKQTNDFRVVGWQSLKCKGHTMNWFAAVPTLIVRAETLTDVLPFSNWLAPAESDHSAGIADQPALPPPEVA
jgi:hypothetical protein